MLQLDFWEVVVAAAILCAPVLVFGAIELAAWNGRRREAMIATRKKTVERVRR